MSQRELVRGRYRLSLGKDRLTILKLRASGGTLAAYIFGLSGLFVLDALMLCVGFFLLFWESEGWGGIAFLSVGLLPLWASLYVLRLILGERIELVPSGDGSLMCRKESPLRRIKVVQLKAPVSLVLKPAGGGGGGKQGLDSWYYHVWIRDSSSNNIMLVSPTLVTNRLGETLKAGREVAEFLAEAVKGEVIEEGWKALR